MTPLSLHGHAIVGTRTGSGPWSCAVCAASLAALVRPTTPRDPAFLGSVTGVWRGGTTRGCRPSCPCGERAYPVAAPFAGRVEVRALRDFRAY